MSSEEKESRGESRRGRGEVKCRREREKLKDSLHMLTQPSTPAPSIYSRTEDRERSAKTKSERAKGGGDAEERWLDC